MGVREKISADAWAWRLSEAINYKARARDGDGRGHFCEPLAHALCALASRLLPDSLSVQQQATVGTVGMLCMLSRLSARWNTSPRFAVSATEPEQAPPYASPACTCLCA